MKEAGALEVDAGAVNGKHGSGEHLEKPTKLQPEGKGGSEQPVEDVKPCSYFLLFRYADKWDILLMICGFIGAAGNGATMPIFSIIFGDLMNGFGQNLNDPGALKEQVNDNVVKFIYVGIGAFIGAYLQMACWTTTAVRQVNRIRHRYLGAVLRQDIGYFDTQATSGRLLQGLNEDCITVQQGIGDKVGMTIFNSTTAVVGIIVAFTRGWDMTLVMLSITPALAIMGFLMSIFMTKSTTRSNKAYADANAIAQQALSNIRTVYSFNGEERTAQAYSTCLEEPLKVGIKQGFMGGFTMGMTNCVAFCAYALALWYGGKRIGEGAYTGGEVLNVLFAALIGGFALGQAAPNLQYFQQAKAAGGRVFHLMQRKPDIDPDAPGETMKAGVQGTLEFKDVVFAYPSRPDVPIFRNFDLEVPAGKTVALVGESGSGKSTVIGLIERFYDPQAGQILLDGVDIRRLQLHVLRAQLGLVSQEPTLFATTIATNISYGKPGCTMEDIISAAESANAHKFIMGLPQGYNTHVGEKGIQLSGGQKQRIAIARAILKNPKILLLDEATSALDAESEHVVQDALDRLMVGRSTVVVAHRLSTVIHADIISVVKRGQIVEQGNHESLLAANGVYANLVSLQQTEGGGEEEDAGQQHSSVFGSENGSAFQPDLSPGSFNMLDKATEMARTAATVEGGVMQGGAAKPFLPGMQVQKAASGWRRFASFQQKPTAVKDAPVPLPEKKEEPEEAHKSVPLKRLAVLNKRELPAGFFGLIGSGVLGFMMPAFSIAFSSLINAFYLPDISEMKTEVRKWSLVFVGIGFGGMLFAVLQSYCFNYMGQKLGKRVRVMLMSALLRQEVGWYDQEKNNSGVLTSKLSADAIAVKGQFGDTMGLLTQNLVTLVGSLIIAFVYGWKMTLVIIGAVPLIGVAAYIQTKLMVASSNKEEESFALANQTAAEALSNIRTIAAFNMEQQVSNLYEEKLEKPTVEARARGNSSGVGFGFSQFALFGVYSLAFWYAGVLVKSGENTFEEVLRVFFCIFMAAFGAAQAQTFFPDVAKGKSATQRVFTIIDRQPTIDASSAEGEKPLQCVGAIVLKDITFAYPSRPEIKVFRNFNLEVPAGNSMALVGESGSGKSTVIGLIERFYDPLAGEVLVDGVDIRKLNLHWLREQIALVSQEPVLFNMTVIENIQYGRPDASLEQVMEAARAANAHTFIEALPEGYDTRVGESGVQLSGGQKQRVAIARAIIKNPRILLLDEATSALDAESEHVVQDALDRLMAGRTTVVVAHRLSTVREADCISVVFKGRMVEQGTHEELMARPQGSYSRLVRNQLQRGKTTRTSRLNLAKVAEEEGAA